MKLGPSSTYPTRLRPDLTATSGASQVTLLLDCRLAEHFERDTLSCWRAWYVASVFYSTATTQCSCTDHCTHSSLDNVCEKQFGTDLLLPRLLPLILPALVPCAVTSMLPLMVIHCALAQHHHQWSLPLHWQNPGGTADSCT